MLSKGRIVNVLTYVYAGVVRDQVPPIFFTIAYQVVIVGTRLKRPWLAGLNTAGVPQAALYTRDQTLCRAQLRPASVRGKSLLELWVTTFLPN